MEARLVYALELFPHLQIELTLFADHAVWLRAYGTDERVALVTRMAVTQFAALPNVHFSIIDGAQLMPNTATLTTANQVFARSVISAGRDVAEWDPWHSLITNTEARALGVSTLLAGEQWLTMASFLGLDEISGAQIAALRAGSLQVPVVHNGDRAEVTISSISAPLVRTTPPPPQKK